jgi:excinuclease ABC subunit C
MGNHQNGSKTSPKLTKQVAELPHSPGVYIYRNSEAEIIYIGKAIDLAKRVRQYFQRDDAVGAKTSLLVSQIKSLETINTLSELDALLLEAKLIYKYQPKYNIIAKDDKSPLYVRLTTHEELPRVLFVRRNDLDKVNKKDLRNDFIFGPFQSGRMARHLLRSLRRSVPYCTQKKRDGKPCFYTHIGLCQPCPSFISKLPENESRMTLVKTYRLNIFRLRDILSGKSSQVIETLTKEMNIFAEKEEFGKAILIRNQLNTLYELFKRKFDPMIYTDKQGFAELAAVEETTQLKKYLQNYFPALTGLSRIECFDISNIMGEYATGSMVVLTDGIIDTSQYRKFKIRKINIPNDPAMMAEVVERRLRHPEWPLPNLFVVDGGKTQITSVQRIFIEKGISIPLIGLAKRQEEVVIKNFDGYKIIRLPFGSPALHVLQRIRDESHRFAISYHRLLRQKNTLSKT